MLFWFNAVSLGQLNGAKSCLHLLMSAQSTDIYTTYIQYEENVNAISLYNYYNLGSVEFTGGNKMSSFFYVLSSLKLF